MQGFNFSTDVRVRFAETDAQGVAHNAEYLVWYEVARIAYLARFGGGYRRIQEAGCEALTTEAHARYLAPVRFDDLVVVHARCSGIRGARFRFDYILECEGTNVADGWTAHAVVDATTFRPARFPIWLKEEIERAETQSP